ncbi:MAG: hypothetical protein P4L84_00490 [Isosphaeraceae bacterium]|nr:hypothetical protein [Isosphaeraceae bacterium]
MALSPLADRLLARVICPHCWDTFAPEQVLWVSEHSDLLGDPLLGPEQPQRFLPSRFTVEGDALDAAGMVCRSLACPKCHLGVPRCALEMETLFLSILGAPGSGKSYFLSALIHELRRTLPAQFAINIGDVDLASNRILNECEESLFFNPAPDQLVPLGDLIPKTELEGELYETIALGNQTITYPRPFLFDLRVRPEHHKYSADAPMARLLCLYDNAGEHFLPGKDTTATPVTRHLAQSRALLFVLDPTQDPRFAAAIRAVGGGPRPAGKGGRVSRQEMILHEAAARIRRYTGLSHSERHPRPLILVLTKVDQWSGLLHDADPSEPWRTLSGWNHAGLDIDRIEQQSSRLRQLLVQFSPEIVSAAEGFAQDVFYIATSALGEQTELDPETGFLGIRPQNIRPRWAAVPLLYALSRTLPGLIPRFRRKPSKAI